SLVPAEFSAAFGLVLPRATEPAKGEAAELEVCKVHVANGGVERRARIVIPFDSEDVVATAAACDLQNGLVGHVAAGDKQVRLGLRDATRGKFLRQGTWASRLVSLGLLPLDREQRN